MGTAEGAPAAVAEGVVDPAALAAVLMAAGSHYRVPNDVFGGHHPHGVDPDRVPGDPG